MRHTKVFIPTLREDPADAEIVSHRLMLRAGLVRKVSSGIYSYLPLGLRVLSKIERIVREEMDNAGALEVLLPALQPAELWRETGRWDQYGKELMRLQDRHARDFCLGPTHEEVITDLVRGEIRSYRQLPVNLYQIQTKFRDEIRPRFGLMRGREFIMKDAYSFDADAEGAKESYRRMYDAYHRIFKRFGLHFRAVEADTGLIGGSSSHEFMVLASTGEEGIASCTACEYAANVERAEALVKTDSEGVEREKVSDKKRVETPGMKSVEEVSTFLKVSVEQLAKTLLFLADGHPVAVLVRGDHQVNEIKLKRLLKVSELVLADTETVQKVTGGPSGFSGPVGLKDVEIIADRLVETMMDVVVGANEKDTHYLHVNPERDFKVGRYEDIRNVVAGDPCPRCGQAIVIDRGIEVGHVFMLGTKYSEAMKATFLDQNGKKQFFEMGCYGIGVSRIMAAAIEQNHDDKGIIWPMPIAPFSVHVIPVQEKSDRVMMSAELIYSSLLQAGVETLLEDRKERIGVKFNDADLLGIPYQVIIGENNLHESLVEVKNRRTGETKKIEVEKIINYLIELLEDSPDGGDFYF
ncbi:MAG: proline--tRNA ligase [Nitrospira sp.]|nr:proline--tRNA ligase [Candidatus Manganitrophaceae bacterium]HIL35007.1 proline--tRNA ligase [Candidatus Manganitrophaceae bacterium]